MSITSLRFRITATLIAGFCIAAVICGGVFYSFEMSRRDARLHRLKLLLDSLFEQQRYDLANAIFAGQDEALRAIMRQMGQVTSVKAVTLYKPDGALLITTGQAPMPSLSIGEREALNRGSRFDLIAGDGQASLARLSTAIEMYGEYYGYLRLDYDLAFFEQEATFNFVFFVVVFLTFQVILVAGLQVLLSRTVIRPVQVLRDAIRQIQAGRLGVQVHMTTNDEVGQMFAAFNEMSRTIREQRIALDVAFRAQDNYAVKLETTNRQLESLNADLENLVAARAGELLESNRQLRDEIQERIRAEADLATEKQRLAVTLQSIAEGVIATDTRGRVLSINPVAEEVTGWDQGKAHMQAVETVFRQTPGTGAGREPHPVREVLETGRQVTSSGPVFLLERNGGTRSVSYSAAPIREDDNVMGAVLVFRDVTEEKMRESERVRAAKLESLGVLAGGIAHDFNNILTGILGNLTLGKMYLDPESPSHRKLVEAEKATVQAKGLARQLLTFSKGGAPIKTTTTIGELLSDTVAFSVAGSRVRYDVDVPPDLWPLNADSSQISQVINNIVLNAVQAMPDGGIVRVNASNLEYSEDRTHPPLPAGRYVLIRIEDEGTGIPDNVLPKIFDPYFTTKPQGSGLGLSTSYSIVRNHKGHIEVHSAPGQGTLFQVYLPATRGGALKETVVQETFVRGKGRVLVMDDEPYILEVISEALKLLGYDVVVTRDGLQAIERYRESLGLGNPFDALIMDLTVPGGIGGKEAMEQLQRIDPDARAIVSSGYFQDPVMARFREFGFRGVLPKPFRIEELSRVLEDVLHEG